MLPPRALSNSARQVLHSGASVSWLLIVVAIGFVATGTCFAVCGPQEPLLYRIMGFAVLGLIPALAAGAAAALAIRLSRTISVAVDPAERLLVRCAAAAIWSGQKLRRLIGPRLMSLAARGRPMVHACMQLAQGLTRRGSGSPFRRPKAAAPALSRPFADAPDIVGAVLRAAPPLRRDVVRDHG